MPVPGPFPVLRPATVLAAILCLLPAADLVAQEGRFGEEVSVVVVEVPVQVLRDGDPVRGLTRDDFEVMEGRKRREIVAFEMVDLSLAEAAPEPTALPIAARRHFLLFFDLAFSRPASIVRAREAALELVETALHPSDLVGVATYSSAEGIRLPLGFTSDRRQVALAIRTLGLPQLVEAVKDPLGLVLADRQTFGLDLGSDAGGGGGVAAEGRPDAGAEVQALLESMESSTRRDAARNDVLALTSSLGGLAEVLRAVDGRTHVVFLSEGFDSSVLLGIGRGVDAEEQRIIQEQAEAAASGRIEDVSSDLRFGNTSTQDQLTQALQEFVRAGASIQSVDIGGLRAGTDSARTRGEDGLFVLASETGGEFLRNYNNLSVAMGEVLERTSVTYLLAFEASDVKPDGKYRDIKVRLRDGGRGTRLVHRPGYFAPAPGDQAPGRLRLATAERILGGEEGGDLSTSLLVGAFPLGAGDRAHVPVIVEIDGPSLLAGLRGEQVPTEIYAYAIAADGSVSDFFTRAVALDLAQVGPTLRQTGFKYLANLELAPGTYSIRVLVRNSQTGASGLRAARLEVPAADAGLLLPPVIPEPPTRWVLAREEADYAYPYLMGSEIVVPAARPVVSANTRTPILLAGYHLGGEQLGAKAELRAADGTLVEGVELALSQRLPGGGAGFERLIGDLTWGAVAAGSYELVVTVRDEATGATRSSSITVDVAG